MSNKNGQQQNNMSTKSGKLSGSNISFDEIASKDHRTKMTIHSKIVKKQSHSSGKDSLVENYEQDKELQKIGVLNSL